MPALYLVQFGIESPPAVVWHVEEEALQHDLDRPAEEQFDLDRWVVNTRGGLERLTAEADSSRIDLDRAISELEEIEAGVSRILGDAAKMRREAPIIRSRVARQGASERVREMTYFKNVAEEWLRATKAVLPAIRDARWQLMAIRAEKEDAGDVPTFEDADSLIAYLTG